MRALGFTFIIAVFGAFLLLVIACRSIEYHVGGTKGSILAVIAFLLGVVLISFLSSLAVVVCR